MFLLGTIVNGLAIIFGALLGSLIRNIPEKMKTTIMQAIGLAVIILGISMGPESKQFVIVIGSLVVGGYLGERFDLDDKFNRVGRWLEKKIAGRKENKGDGSNEGNFGKAFVMTTIIYAVGAMSLLGAIDSGVRGDHSILYTKALLDGFSAIIFTSTLGIGVLFSAFPVMLYQGTIALFAKQIVSFIPPELMDLFIIEVTATGGIMILAIGLNILGLTKVRVANLLPAIVVVFFFVSIQYYFFL